MLKENSYVKGESVILYCVMSMGIYYGIRMNCLHLGFNWRRQCS